MTRKKRLKKVFIKMQSSNAKADALIEPYAKHWTARILDDAKAIAKHRESDEVTDTDIDQAVRAFGKLIFLIDLLFTF